MNDKDASDAERMHDALRAYISANGLKSSKQRELIADTFFVTGGHLRIEDLLEEVKKRNDGIGQATVYRTIKLLTECGLAEPHQFGDGHTRYEAVTPDDDEHHDHLICILCGKIVEFMDERIETLQVKVARDHGFTVTDHKMELYGKCSECQKK